MYKFLSISPDKKDASLYVTQCIKDMESPIKYGGKTLEKVPSKELLSQVPSSILPNGKHVHLSLHPNRIYLKDKSQEKNQHLWDETIPQKFNGSGYRLLCIFTPPPISHMEIVSKQPSAGVCFEWNDTKCPQLSIYEVQEGRDGKEAIHAINIPARYHIIESDGKHPTLVLQIKKTEGGEGVWKPYCAVFGKVIKRSTV